MTDYAVNGGWTSGDYDNSNANKPIADNDGLTDNNNRGESLIIGNLLKMPMTCNVMTDFWFLMKPKWMTYASRRYWKAGQYKERKLMADTMTIWRTMNIIDNGLLTKALPYANTKGPVMKKWRKMKDNGWTDINM